MGKKQQKQETQKQQKNDKIFQAFFSGLPYESTQEQLIQFLGTNDGIISVKMPRYQDTNRCRGYAHIKFSDEQAYNNALSKNGQHLGGRYLSIEAAKGEKQPIKTPNIPVGCKSLFVKGLPYNLTQQELKKEFSSCGAISDVRMVRNSVNRKFKGFAYIDFKDPNSMKKAVKKYHSKEFQGRRLTCDASITNMKKGYKKRDEQDNDDNDQQQ